ncbi:putative peptidyl-tRNA hydrolase [Curvularia clavata]|uniref:peptidyl-tRNA hydrolase n=1 Tax=Curvularia clavata TaxID=95742 RepID=A0A9Q8Z3W5_CURCL|nr:putative peptidyl-tRNA hydrolase [Curvularia clavata]
MSDASTRVHVASPTEMLLIPATDLQAEVKNPEAPAQEDGGSDSDSCSDFPEPKTKKQLRREKNEEKQRRKALDLAAAISSLHTAQNQTLDVPNDSANEQLHSTQPPSQSRKEKRKEKKKRHDSALPTPSDTDAEVPVQQSRNPSKQKHRPTNQHLPAIPHLLMAKPAAQTAYPLLVASIGNPGASFANTLHSAGHIVTSSLSHAKNYTPFQKGLSGLVSRPQPTHLAFSLTGFRRVESERDVYEDWTFWQSTSLMNVSGNGVKRAYNEWLREIRRQTGESTLEGRLVVVHDELESALGKVTIRDGAASAKGHNGIKSCQQQLAGLKWWRVGVGIGRPESRDPNVVSKYVLGKMTAFQRSQLEKTTVPVFKALEDIAAGKK